MKIPKIKHKNTNRLKQFVFDYLDQHPNGNINLTVINGYWTEVLAFPKIDSLSIQKGKIFFSQWQGPGQGYKETKVSLCGINNCKHYEKNVNK